MATKVARRSRGGYVSERTIGMWGEKAEKGDWAESVATSFLFENGFKVFRSFGRTGPVDLIGLDHDGLICFDVKYVEFEKRLDGGIKLIASNRLNEAQKKMGIQLLYVARDGTCGFETEELREKLELLYGEQEAN